MAGESALEQLHDVMTGAGHTECPSILGGIFAKAVSYVTGQEMPGGSYAAFYRAGKEGVHRVCLISLEGKESFVVTASLEKEEKFGAKLLPAYLNADAFLQALEHTDRDGEKISANDVLDSMRPLDLDAYVRRFHKADPVQQAG